VVEKGEQTRGQEEGGQDLPNSVPVVQSDLRQGGEKDLKEL